MDAEQLNIKDVVALAGAPGLHRILRADTRSVVIESLDEARKRQAVKGATIVSKLSEISIYTTADDSKPLPAVLQAIRTTFGDTLPIHKKNSSDTELRDFLAQVLPDFDRERVYPSNIRKLAGWYEILAKYQVNFILPESEDDTAEPASEDGAAPASGETSQTDAA